MSGGWRAQYKMRVLEEAKEQKEKEDRLRELEEAEAQLISRLQNAHLMQEEALQSLGRVISTNNAGGGGHY